MVNEPTHHDFEEKVWKYLKLKGVKYTLTSGRLKEPEFCSPHQIDGLAKMTDTSPEIIFSSDGKIPPLEEVPAMVRRVRQHNQGFEFLYSGNHENKIWKELLEKIREGLE